jgi:Ethanolamine utilization protein EutJ (predicted chaperonin)
MIRKFPAKLFDDFIGESLGTFRIVRAQVDIDKAPAVSICHFGTKAVHLVIVAMYRENFRIVDGCTENFASFKVRGNEHTTL